MTIMNRALGFVLIAIALTLSAASAPQAADVQTQDLTLYVGEQQTFTPGYLVGDIQVVNPDVANFRVQPGRRELMLLGKGKGETQLIIWDQKRVKRHEIKLIVRSRDEMKQEYEVEVIEGNVAFQSGTYGKGIEPSGPTLFKKVVRAPLGGDVDILIPGAPLTSKNADKDKSNKGAPATQLKMRLKPTGISDDG